jgi:hypothetical protein
MSWKYTVGANNDWAYTVTANNDWAYTVSEGSGRIWYVRPSGGSYGTENGSSYANAWDGFDNVDWTASGVQPGDTLYVCGTHTEQVTVGGSGIAGHPITIRGDYSGDAGTIDGEDSRGRSLIVGSVDYITISSISLIGATVSCLDITGTSTGIITNNITVSGSGNQGVQHLGSVSATHNNITAVGNTDDGVSGHDDTVITLVGGTVYGNDQGLNVVNSVHLTASDIDFSTGNTSYDVFTRQGDSPGSAWIDISNSDIPGNVFADLDSKVILRNCTVDGTVEVYSATTMSYLEAYDCVFKGEYLSKENSTTTLENCLIADCWDSGVAGIVTATDCVWQPRIIHVLSGASFTANRCLFDFTGLSAHAITLDSGGSMAFEYCIFDNLNSSHFYLLMDDAGTPASYIDNCTFVGVSNAGRGIFARPDTTINNCIFTDLDIGFQSQAGTDVLNNCCFYDNTTDINGSPTNNNPQTGDPELADVANNDYSLGVTSSCIGNGADLGASKDTGIDAATWGNGTSEAPDVTTKDQGASWDIGAYIS